MARYNFRSPGGDATNAIEQLLAQRLAESLEQQQVEQGIASQQSAIRQRDEELKRRTEEDRMQAVLRQQAMAQQEEAQKASLMDKADARAMTFMNADAGRMAAAERAEADRAAANERAQERNELERTIAVMAHSNRGLQDEMTRLRMDTERERANKLRSEAETAAREEAAKKKGIASTRRTIRDLATSLANNPALPGITGAIQGRIPAFMDPESISAISQYEQLVNSLSLAEREKLKGQGSVSNLETGMLAKSVTGMNRAAGPEITRRMLLEIAAAFEGDEPSEAPRGGGGGAPPPGGRVTVISPDGKRGTIPAAQLQDALAQGYKQAQ